MQSLPRDDRYPTSRGHARISVQLTLPSIRRRRHFALGPMPWQARLGWLAWATGFALVASSILANAELASQIKRRDRALYEQRTEPSYLGYEWRFWPRNPCCTNWLNDQRDSLYRASLSAPAGLQGGVLDVLADRFCCNSLAALRKPAISIAPLYRASGGSPAIAATSVTSARLTQAGSWGACWKCASVPAPCRYGGSLAKSA